MFCIYAGNSVEYAFCVGFHTSSYSFFPQTLSSCCAFLECGRSRHRIIHICVTSRTNPPLRIPFRNASYPSSFNSLCGRYSLEVYVSATKRVNMLIGYAESLRLTGSYSRPIRSIVVGLVG